MTASDPFLVDLPDDESTRARRGAPEPSDLAMLVANVRAGMPAAFFLPTRMDRFSTSLQGCIQLACLHFVLAIGCAAILTTPPRAFDVYAITSHALWLLTLPVLAGTLGRESGAGERAILRTTTALLAPLFTGWVFFLGYGLALDFAPHWRSWLIAKDLYAWPWFMLWTTIVSYRLLRSALPLPRRRVGATCLVYGLAILLVNQHVSGPWFWYTKREAARKPAAETVAIDVERTLYAQHDRVARVLGELERGRPGRPDLYVVSVGADARQDVFRKEATYVRELFDRRFGTTGRSVLLLNHADTADEVPLASVSNLRLVLEGLTEVMDPREDVLLVYLTSHGARDHEIRVRFPRFPLNSLSPETLRDLLRDNGYAWPAVLVSACFSGGFVAPLASDRSLVITAAAPDRTSFGCSDDADLTYFARAYFEHQLEHESDLVAAFGPAAALVSGWEAEEGLEASMPQMHAGPAMREKLAAVARAREGPREDRLVQAVR